VAWDNGVDIATGLQAQQSGVCFMACTRNFSHLEDIWISTGAHPTYLMGIGISFPLRMWPGCEVDHSLPSNPEGKNEWSCNSPPHLCLHGMDRDSLLLIF